jgi:hypothetical protein
MFAGVCYYDQVISYLGQIAANGQGGPPNIMLIARSFSFPVESMPVPTKMGSGLSI